MPVKHRVSERLAVRRLTLDRADAAYPLARMAAPQMTLGEWRATVAKVGGMSSATESLPGILVAETKERYVCGLCTYHYVVELAHGFGIAAADFVVVDLIDVRPVTAALLAALTQEATKVGCRAVHVHLAKQVAYQGEGANGVARMLADAGYRIATAPLRKWTLSL